MMEDLVIEWMWFDAIYEICGGEVVTRFFFNISLGDRNRLEIVDRVGSEL